MKDEPVQPGDLVIEFWPGLRIAVGRIDAANNVAVNSGLDVTALSIQTVARQRGAGDNRLADPRTNRNPVPTPLTDPNGLVAKILKLPHREHLLFALQLLKTEHIRLFLGQPLAKNLKPTSDAINIEGSDFHGRVHRD